MQRKTRKTIFNLRLFVVVIVSCFFVAQVSAQYQLRIQYLSKDTLFQPQALKLQTSFTNQLACEDYINKLTALLNSKGYAASSIDTVKYDSSFAEIALYLGTQQNWVQLKTVGIEKRALDESGYMSKNFTNKPINFTQLTFIKERLLNYYEKNGYPFAAVFLDSIQLKENNVTAILSATPGPLYHIDSIRINGKAKISNNFLQHYLGIPKGSVYNKEKLELVSKRMLELPYVQEQQPSELMMLGTGSILNVYLQPKRSSQVNFLIGFLPASDATGKLQLTGDVNLNLKNSLGKGETILLNWQQLQLKSPRLNLGFQQPYIFNSPFGIDFLFEMFKKDSSFVQLNAQLGVQYLLSANQSGKLFIQKQNSFLLAAGIDTNQIKATKQLPANIDVSAVNIGIDYNFNNTNYRFNPKSGNELQLYSTIGIKTISRNNDIISLTDPAFNYASLYDSLKLKGYQLRIKAMAAHYFTTGKRSTLKVVLNTGVFNSPNVFRNELFQIGGYKLLRGFDEESIYATRYLVSTVEYRYLVGLNSYLFGFVDAGWVKNKYQTVDVTSNFISTGIGILFETKLGLLNMSFAVGKRNDVNFNLSQSSKIHFGYINYF
ncbi:BamA/TamA family outer membrane protein [Ferruginibacter paludis]|uniref:BamA/TamA family outer membrane protein n=1 Tax=Ferruginibacter paludis TaxID=1310417 RepID=UPI0025B41CD9|nr:BamA/TamA family outer membrane protein [Ferruginibacter paludis]MDN3658582.1 BamA/TamA family outer membrane protein [Ferruginibacter paludis]